MKDRILMVLFVLILGTILTASLIAVDFYTTPVIETNEALRIKSSVLEALEIAYGAQEIEQTFAENVEEKSADGTVYYVSRSNEVAFQFEGAGLWGPISGVIALQPSMDELKGVTIISQEETPGLGGRISEPEYLGKFKGAPFAQGLRSVAPGKGSGSRDIDTITGATMTSDAFVGILNSELDRVVPAVKGGRP
jgi:Na+-transporting NADH:ubiquinone oxidoreductase subunit C